MHVRMKECNSEEDVYRELDTRNQNDLLISVKEQLYCRRRQVRTNEGIGYSIAITSKSFGSAQYKN